MKHQPRTGDLPRERLMKLADDAIAIYGGPSRASVNFKFTCEHCGERCTLTEPNQLFERGICYRCGRETIIAFGGFTLRLNVGDRHE